MADVTTPWDLPFPESTDPVKEGASDIEALAERIKVLLTPYDSGSLALRPVSTPGTPGIRGREYFATDSRQLFKDYGTGWLDISPALRGQVSSSGVIVAGSGFTVVRLTLGNYAVTFTNPFVQPPIVTATPYGTSSQVSAQVPSVAANEFTVMTYAGAALADTAFMFVALPR